METVAGEGIGEEEAQPESMRRKRRFRPLRWLLYGILGLLALIVILLFAIDTPPGRRFIIDQVEALEMENGMQIRIGRIDGSIYNSMTISDLRLYDPEGLFFEAPELQVDWRPFSFLLDNTLHIESASSDLLILHKLPELIPSEEEDQPLLPGFDIFVGDLDVAQLRIDESVTGERQRAALAGNIDIRSGRALVNLRGRSLDGGERLVLALDAEPDGDVFDVDMEMFAPEDGIVAGLTGFNEDLTVDIAGSGSWTRWDGTALVDVGNARVMDLDLDAQEGVYTIGGTLRTAPLFEPGLIRRLTAPETNFSATGTFADQNLVGEFSLRSAAAVIEGRGGVDLDTSSFDAFTTDIRMLQPQALADDLRGRDVRLRLNLNGPFQSANFTYLLTTPQAAFGTTAFTNLRVAGEGRVSGIPFTLPLSATADRITGVGATAEEILRNVGVDGEILITEDQIVADDLRFRATNAQGRADIIYSFATGQYAVGLSGTLNSYYVPGLGVVDLTTDVDVRPGRGGGFQIGGRARIVARSLENSAIANLLGGLPTIDTEIAYGPDGRFVFDNARVRAAGFSFDGSGYYTQDGRLLLNGSGRSAQYGAFRVRAEGPATHPQVALALANPLPAAGLEDVTVNLDPNARGFAYRAEGGSMAGPFSTFGQIVLPGNAPVSVEVTELLVADTRSTGQITLADAGIVGNFDLTGSGLDGDIILEPRDGVQAVHVTLNAEEATLGGQIATTIRQGMLELDAVLYDEPQIVASLNAVGVRREGLSIARVAASADMRGLENGEVTMSIAGSRGREFDFAANAQLEPGRITVNGGGEFQGEPITLTPVIVETGEDGYILRESTITYAGGGATVSGEFGGARTAVDATLDAIPLSLVDIFLPDTGFGGELTGTVDYALEPGEAIPTANAEIRVRSLTRAGFALRPRPVNLGLNARLGDGRLAARTIMESEGEEILRGQVRLDNMTGISLGEAIATAPLFAELRYNGPAETIWQLTGNELLNLSGPLLARADASGTLTNPVYSGSMETRNARLESTLTGTVVENVNATGEFADARFTLPSFTGTTPGGGSISGSAVFDLGLASGFGMNIQIDANEAWLLRRDDISARVSGPIAIVLQAPAGTALGTEENVPVGSIAGDLDIVEGIFELGNVTPSTQVPQLNVTEINRRLDEPVDVSEPIDWTLDFDIAAEDQFLVRGLGLDSEWDADLEVRGPLVGFGIFGQLNLVRGAYSFAGKRFELERGRIEFFGNQPVNPTLDIVAQGGVEGLDATITITGTGTEPDIAFTSVPALPQSELLSRLLFGTSITNLSAPEALQLGAAVASLQGGGGGGLNPINAVRDAIGLDRLRIVPADPVEGHGTAVAGGLYVADDFYAEVITDGQGYSASSIEFQVTRWLSLLSSISTIGRASAGVEVSIDY